jgi:uncharacterized protein (TIGR03083 family)
VIREPTGEGYLERGGIRLHWLEWAPSHAPEPPDVLLLHGLSSNARYWERIARRFPHRRLVALDQRAHGLSDAPLAGYAMDDLAGDVAEVITELGLGRPVVAGHSWGGSVALDVAATLPDRISGLALFDGPISAMSDRLSWEDASRLMQPPLPRYRDLAEAFETTHALLGEAWGDDLMPFVEAGLRRDGDAWVLTLSAPIRLQILEQLYQFRPEAALAAVQAPLMVGVALGDPGMRAWKEEGVKRLQETRPDADVRWYESRHDIPLIRADEVATDLERLTLRAGLAEMARVAGELEGDWSRPATEGWTARDLLAHVSSSVAAIPAVLRAGPPAPGAEPAPPFDADRWNASMVRRRAEQPPEALVAEIDAAVRDLTGMLRDLDLDRPVHAGPSASQPVAEAMRVVVSHGLTHLEELRAALSR